jgi:Domain of unknown function (DUF4145)
MKNGNQLALERCPHCSVAKPRISHFTNAKLESKDSEGRNVRVWRMYLCNSCGGAILTVSKSQDFDGEIDRMWPEGDVLSDSIPDRARDLLKQAMESINTPAGAQVLAAASIDSMLKTKGYKEGVLNSRIKAAEADHLITPEMAEWAHEVRLDANNQRHADESVPLPTKEDAEKTIAFAKALAQFLFVLPALVTRGRGASTGKVTPVPATRSATAGFPGSGA